uniref:KH homology domain-containing protein 4 n=1 Tax=Platynereis dumerilii TaxID=6359 RepID=C7SB52_PLADU|nr:splicing factor 1 K-like RNA-binding domain protein [Platynereis dumerilii]ACH87547.1 splicing factor 1 K-like RNA-binding domain protein [Platynereis dumerilii]
MSRAQHKPAEKALCASRQRSSKWEDARQPRSSLEAAAEAAAKVNAMLIAKGKLRPSQLSQIQPTKTKAGAQQPSANLVVAEVEINDAPIGCRNMLTRGSTQDEISKMSGAAVSTRGRYMAPDENRATTSNYKYVFEFSAAVFRIKEIIANGTKPKGAPTIRLPPPPGPPVIRQPLLNQPPPLMSLNTQPPAAIREPITITLVQEKLLVGLEHAPPSFDVKGKLLGPAGSFLQHIQSETGAKVSLRGRASGFIEPNTGREALEPMHVFIQHPTLVGLQQAKSLSENLIQTVQQEYAQFQQALATLPPPPNITQGTTALLTALPQHIPSGGNMTIIGQHQQPVSITAIGQQPAPGVPMSMAIGEHFYGLINSPSFDCCSAIISSSVFFENEELLSSLDRRRRCRCPAPQAGVPSLLSAPVMPTSTLTTSLLTNPHPVSAGAVSSQQGGVYTSGNRIFVNTSIPPPTLVGTVSAANTQFATTGFTSAGGMTISQPLQQISIQPNQLQPGQVVTQSMVGQPMQQPVVGPPSPQGFQIHQVAVGQAPPQIQTPAPQFQPVASMAPPQLALPSHVSLAQPPPMMPPPQIIQAPQTPGLPPHLAMPPGQPQQLALPPHLQPPPEHEPPPQHHPPLAQPTGDQYYQQYVHQPASLASSGPVSYTPTSTTYTFCKVEERGPKRRFTEEKQEEKMPENLLGYEGSPPPQTVVTSSPSYGEEHRMMPPPPHSPGKMDRDKQLMPPPPPPPNQMRPPSNGEPDRKRLKGSLGSVSAYGSDEEDDDVHSTMRQHQRDAAKYQFNQISGKPQIYQQQQLAFEQPPQYPPGPEIQYGQLPPPQGLPPGPPPQEPPQGLPPQFIEQQYPPASQPGQPQLIGGPVQQYGNPPPPPPGQHGLPPPQFEQRPGEPIPQQYTAPPPPPPPPQSQAQPAFINQAGPPPPPPQYGGTQYTQNGFQQTYPGPPPGQFHPPPPPPGMYWGPN